VEIHSTVTFFRSITKFVRRGNHHAKLKFARDGYLIITTLTYVERVFRGSVSLSNTEKTPTVPN